MTPQTMSMPIPRSRREASRMKPIEIIEPTNAAKISVAEWIAAPRLRKRIIARATVSFAPEETPST